MQDPIHMNKLLIPLFLLMGCLPQLATAQKAPFKKTQHKHDSKAYHSPEAWVAGEFCSNYNRHFNDMPEQYRVFAYNCFDNVGFTPNYVGALAWELARREDLREVAYMTIYVYCFKTKSRSQKTLKGYIYSTLTQQFQIPDPAATILAGYIMSRYDNPKT